MFEFLNKPYPVPEPGKRALMQSLGVGVFIALALIFLLPFGIGELKLENRTFKLLGFGVIAGSCVFLYCDLIPRFLPGLFIEKHWTILKEMLCIAFLLLTIGLINGFYNSYAFNHQYNFENSIGLIGNTFVLGIVPAAFVVGLEYIRLLKKFQTQSEGLILNTDFSANLLAQELPVLNLHGDGELELLNITADQFCYCESSSNYVSIFYEENGTLQKTIFRATLSNLLKQLSAPGILRCHRSYIVNLNKVSSVSGNAQGFKLQIPNIPDPVPVSRKYVPEVRAWFKG